jgi:hypothetical protein
MPATAQKQIGKATCPCDAQLASCTQAPAYQFATRHGLALFQERNCAAAQAFVLSR